ncbi:amidohydrolase/deacetylase family metallohydrolase [Sedimentitalea todarodis]|uniref:Amidohydrolase/deacetylase family metallohydrolase n=1 Tax=Sedimentitalea todarodis TaxID=1631240 RepID=A0ABU3VJI5_9RHOB|nr:amidohydrolase/deacetylase family metallohydrolase [Sedimentitalea todarodis]MDU9006351.1 amidohydrolase/deacetylase family metallohydrolase [Sedimentitalea todarodis]
MGNDLVLTGGRVIDPAQGIDRVTDVAFCDGKVSEVGDGLTARSRQDVSGQIVTPGLIDLHTHVYWGGTSLGVDPDAYAYQSAVTTTVDAGSAGPGNFPGFKAHMIDPAQSRILAYLHVSFAGIYAFSPTVMVGESHDMRLMAAREAVAMAEAHRDSIIGIKVRVGRHASGDSGDAPLRVAMDTADQAGLPLMCHIDEPPPTYADVVDMLRPGDVLTHCFRPFPNAPVLADGTIRQSVLRARERGVLFDVGHGMGSFSWKTAKAMMAAGFAPDTISSDVHAMCIEGPAWDLLRTMTKFLALGMSLADVIAKTTLNAADAIRRPDLGTLTPGAAGDASILSLDPAPIDLEDVLGNIVSHPERLVAHGLVIGGNWRQAAS